MQHHAALVCLHCSLSFLEFSPVVCILLTTMHAWWPMSPKMKKNADLTMLIWFSSLHTCYFICL